ncbi:hypothetical protein Dsin_010866 [Dipteronia sinensis]|uniref:Uncharacterized protein n=1 Tax=Dipteronia sinensis TaxID=43782 RepID=A0AAE0AT96_9ROSI|nr:hypothetical protein Dsin_010866 [Dipteronia sinensis]
MFQVRDTRLSILSSVRFHVRVQPDLRLFTKFGHGDGSVKALVTVGNKVFTAHQDSRIRVWKVSRRSENVFRLVDTLPTTKDYLGKFMKQSSRRRDKRACASRGMVYSASADGKIKAWSKETNKSSHHSLKGILEGHKDVSLNSVVVSDDGRWCLWRWIGWIRDGLGREC